MTMNKKEIKKECTDNSLHALLETGRYYLIRESVKTKVTNRKIKYCGIDKHNSKEYHNFFDEFTRLFHWIDADKLEPCL